MSARREFWYDLAERAGKTAAQAAAGVLAGTTVLAIDWRQAALIVGTAVLASVLTSLGSAQIGDVDTASVIRRPQLGSPLPPIVSDLADVAIQQTPNVVRTVESATTAWAKALRGDRQ